MITAEELERVMLEALDEPPKIRRRRFDPSEPSEEISNRIDRTDATAGGERVASDRRAAHKNVVTYAPISESARRAVSSETMVDRASLPVRLVRDREFLDLEKICKALDASSSGLGTIAMTRPALRCMVDAGLREAFGRPEHRDITHLVGRIMPVFGQLRATTSSRSNDDSALIKNGLPVTDACKHSFAFKPVVISTIGEVPGDQGEIVALGVVVSNKTVNFGVGDDRRVSLGRHPAFEESMCWVLVVHVYAPVPISYASLGPPSTKKTCGKYAIVHDFRRNAYDHVFRWTEFMNSRTEHRGCGVSSFGFTDTKQSGKDVVRQMTPWSIAHGQRVLDEARANGQLENMLIDAPMTIAGKRASMRAECPSGIDVRRFLLIEMLLTGTPLDRLLVSQHVSLDFEPPEIPGGGPGAYERLRSSATQV